MLNRRDFVAKLLESRGDLLVVAGLGASAWDITAAGDNDLNFPLWGGMGGALTVGLGLALAVPARPVLVITGDGELLMGLNSLATISVSNPNNLSIVVLDNQRYGETGMQKTHTAFGVDLLGVARSCGIKRVQKISLLSEIALLRSEIHRKKGTLFCSVSVSDKPCALVLPPRDGVELKNRFRKKLLGAVALEQN